MDSPTTSCEGYTFVGVLLSKNKYRKSIILCTKSVSDMASKHIQRNVCF